MLIWIDKFLNTAGSIQESAAMPFRKWMERWTLGLTVFVAQLMWHPANVAAEINMVLDPKTETVSAGFLVEPILSEKSGADGVLSFQDGASYSGAQILDNIDSYPSGAGPAASPLYSVSLYLEFLTDEPPHVLPLKQCLEIEFATGDESQTMQQVVCDGTHFVIERTATELRISADETVLVQY